MKKQKKNNPVPTNGWDVLKTIIDGLFNFMSLNKVGAFALFWFVIRDIIFVIKLPENYDYAGHLLNDKFIGYVISNDNITIIICMGIIAFLLVSCIALILYIIFLRKEINRIAEVRSEAMHGKEKLKVHISSES